MNKAGLTDAVAAKTGLSKKDSDKAISAVFDTIKTALASGDKVSLIGFGTFETKVRKARIARNPRTKETINLPEQTIPVFKAGSALKNEVSK